MTNSHLQKAKLFGFVWLFKKKKGRKDKKESIG